jgi:integrase
MNMQTTVVATDRHKTLAEVIAHLEGAAQLGDTRRRDLISAVNTAARLLNRNVAEIQANMPELRQRLSEVHHVQAGISAKRLANVKADLGAALMTATPPPLVIRPRRRAKARMAAWEALIEGLAQPWQRYTLARLATFCAARGIVPTDVTDEVIARFRVHLGEGSIAKDPDKVIKITAQTWNGIAARNDLSLTKLTVQRTGRYRTIPLTSFPASFQAEVDAWIERLSHADLFDDDGPAKALRPTSLRNIRAELRQFATALVHAGRPIDEITSLATLVELNAFKSGLRHFIDRNGGKPPPGLEGMASKLLAIARHSLRMPSHELDKLRTIKARLKVERPGMTDKNRTRLGQFEENANIMRLLRLPQAIMAEARKAEAPSSRVGLRVMHAVAIEILLAVPMRSGNLAALDIERHFHWRRQGKARILAIAIPGSEVKNGQPIEADMQPDTTRLISAYLKTYRTLVSEAPGDWLFPARSGGARLPGHLSPDLSRLIKRELGLAINGHLFRHLAGFLFLKQNPGGYEIVRRILGHKKMSTTTTFYTDLESKWALKEYDEAVLSKRGAS